eukprot:GDKJ01026215.1.p1 GENE.GDKJ01026215.1~~GDKJ01026215.1.p1  ORF type:complete len:783 (+),score=194.85 GDKJ01026215.1:47-2350(+)
MNTSLSTIRQRFETASSKVVMVKAATSSVTSKNSVSTTSILSWSALCSIFSSLTAMISSIFTLFSSDSSRDSVKSDLKSSMLERERELRTLIWLPYFSNSPSPSANGWAFVSTALVTHLRRISILLPSTIANQTQFPNNGSTVSLAAKILFTHESLSASFLPQNPSLADRLTLAIIVLLKGERFIHVMHAHDELLAVSRTAGLLTRAVTSWTSITTALLCPSIHRKDYNASPPLLFIRPQAPPLLSLDSARASSIRPGMKFANVVSAEQFLKMTAGLSLPHPAHPTAKSFDLGFFLEELCAAREQIRGRLSRLTSVEGSQGWRAPSGSIVEFLSAHLNRSSPRRNVPSKLVFNSLLATLQEIDMCLATLGQVNGAYALLQSLRTAGVALFARRCLTEVFEGAGLIKLDAEGEPINEAQIAFEISPPNVSQNQTGGGASLIGGGTALQTNNGFVHTNHPSGHLFSAPTKFENQNNTNQNEIDLNRPPVFNQSHNILSVSNRNNNILLTANNPSMNYQMPPGAIIASTQNVEKTPVKTGLLNVTSTPLRTLSAQFQPSSNVRFSNLTPAPHLNKDYSSKKENEVKSTVDLNSAPVVGNTLFNSRINTSQANTNTNVLSNENTSSFKNLNKLNPISQNSLQLNPTPQKNFLSSTPSRKFPSLNNPRPAETPLATFGNTPSRDNANILSSQKYTSSNYQNKENQEALPPKSPFKLLVEQKQAQTNPKDDKPNILGGLFGGNAIPATPAGDIRKSVASFPFPVTPAHPTKLF